MPESVLNTPAHVFVKLAVLVRNEQVFMSLGNSLSGCVTQRKATSVARGLERTAELPLSLAQHCRDRACRSHFEVAN